MTARMMARIAGGFVAVVVSGYLVWISVTGLLDEPPNAWIYVVALALVPWILAFAIALPDLVAPETSHDRTYALFAPVPAALFSLGLFVCTIALAVEIDSWGWSVAVVVCGVVLALENFGSMRRAHDALAKRAVQPAPPTPRRVGLFAARMAVFLIAFVFVVGSVGYVVLERTGLLLALALVGVGLVWSIVTATRGMRRGRTTGP